MNAVERLGGGHIWPGSSERVERKRDFPYNTKQGCFGNEKEWKTRPSPMGREHRGPGAHWDCTKI